MRVAPLTLLLILANGLGLVLALVAGAPLVGGEAELLIRLGGNFAPLTTGGEWWRLATAPFLHAGIIHLGFNMFALHQAGVAVERLFGSFALALIYAGAGLAGGAASLWWRQDTVSVGASGAVFGVYGALLAYLSIGHLGEAREMLRPLRSGALMFIAYSMAFGLLTPGIDNAAHLGGLAGGALLGAGLAPLASARAPSLPRAAAAVAVVLAMAAALIAMTPETAQEYARERALERTIDHLTAADRELSARLATLQERLRAAELGEGEALQALEGELIPGWQRLVDRLGAPALRRPEREALRRELLRYATLRRDALTMLAQAIREDDPALAAEARRRHDAALRLAERLAQHAAGSVAGGRAQAVPRARTGE